MGLGGMFAHRRLEDDARALAAELVEFRDLLLEQAALGFGWNVSLHDPHDVVAQLLARHVSREIVLIRRKRPGGRRGNPKRGSGDLQQSDQVFPGHGVLRAVCSRPCCHGTNMATPMPPPSVEPRVAYRAARASERAGPGVAGAGAQRWPIAAALGLRDRAPPGSSTSMAPEPGVAIPVRPPLPPRWCGPPDAAFP